jgi:hypothetical protein
MVKVMSDNHCISPTTCADSHNIIFVNENIFTYTIITLGMMSLLHLIQSYGIYTHGSPIQEVRLRDFLHFQWQELHNHNQPTNK